MLYLNSTPEADSGAPSKKTRTRARGRVIAAVNVIAAIVTIFAAGLAIGDRLAPLNWKSPLIRSELWYGYFADCDTNGIAVVAEEKFVLERKWGRLAGVESVRATSEGQIPLDSNRKVKRSWQYVGFSSGEFLVYTYASDTRTEYGIGSCFLRNKGSHYEGTWIGRDTAYSRILRGPYVLTREKISVDLASQEFPILKTIPTIVEGKPSLADANALPSAP